MPSLFQEDRSSLTGLAFRQRITGLQKKKKKREIDSDECRWCNNHYQKKQGIYLQTGGNHNTGLKSGNMWGEIWGVDKPH
jgi:formate dehydrogenase assembly factor FdhD